MNFRYCVFIRSIETCYVIFFILCIASKRDNIYRYHVVQTRFMVIISCSIPCHSTLISTPFRHSSTARFLPTIQFSPGCSVVPRYTLSLLLENILSAHVGPFASPLCSPLTSVRISRSRGVFYLSVYFSSSSVHLFRTSCFFCT